MKIAWTVPALVDVERLHAFIEAENPRAAREVIETILEAPERLIMHPRMGERVNTITRGEVRRLIIHSYELRYEVLDDLIRVLRIFHGREQR